MAGGEGRLPCCDQPQTSRAAGAHGRGDRTGARRGVPRPEAQGCPEGEHQPVGGDAPRPPGAPRPQRRAPRARRGAPPDSRGRHRGCRSARWRSRPPDRSCSAWRSPVRSGGWGVPIGARRTPRHPPVGGHNPVAVGSWSPGDAYHRPGPAVDRRGAHEGGGPRGPSRHRGDSETRGDDQGDDSGDRRPARRAAQQTATPIEAVRLHQVVGCHARRLTVSGDRRCDPGCFPPWRRETATPHASARRAPFPFCVSD